MIRYETRQLTVLALNAKSLNKKKKTLLVDEEVNEKNKDTENRPLALCAALALKHVK